MKLYLDTNILLDMVSRREPFCRASTRVYLLCAEKVHEGLAADFTFCTIAYVLRREKSAAEMRSALRSINDVLAVVPVGPKAIAEAIANFRTDFEDEVQFRAALAAGADVIITRDKDGFANATIPVMTPTEFLDKIESD